MLFDLNSTEIYSSEFFLLNAITFIQESAFANVIRKYLIRNYLTSFHVYVIALQEM